MHHSSPADAIVVGSGLFGLATAWHLVEAGTTVTVVDSGDPATGTTAAGAGFVGLWAAGYAHYWNESERDLEQYGIDFYGRLAGGGRDILYRAGGNLWLSVTEGGYRDHILPFDENRLRPDGARLLTPTEVVELAPGVSERAITGGYLHPGGIQISAPDAALALVDALRERGVEFVANNRVDSVLVEGGRAVGVRLASGGELRADSIVIAAGSWTNELLAPFDRELPFLRVIASRLTTRPFGLGTMPTLMLPELDGLWVREHRGGLTYGNASGYQPLFVTQSMTAQSTTAQSTAEITAERRPQRTDLIDAMRAELLPVVGGLVPSSREALAETEWTQGIVSYTADRRFFAGPVPDASGLFVVAGCNESGVTHGPGLGRLTAELVLSGASTLGDPRLYTIDRFGRHPFESEADVAAAMPPRRAVDLDAVDLGTGETKVDR